MFIRNQRRGFSLIELLIVIAIILIIITIAMPKLQRAQIAARDMAAIQAVKTIHTVQVQYYSQYGRYATTLAELGPPASGNPSSAAADLIGNDLANGEKQGYKYILSGTPGGYVILAQPVTYNSSGSKNLYSDQSMTIHVNEGPEPATVQSKELR
jgi:prepilin-type N-terminal cleavage/methylation domain-containing protein